MAGDVIDSAALDIFGLVMLGLGVVVLALPVIFVIYVIYKILDNR